VDFFFFFFSFFFLFFLIFFFKKIYRVVEKKSAIKLYLSIDLINSTIKYIRTSITWGKVITNVNLTLYMSTLQYATSGIKMNSINIHFTQIITSQAWGLWIPQKKKHLSTPMRSPQSSIPASSTTTTMQLWSHNYISELMSQWS
jgi:hypothetical protein